MEFFYPDSLFVEGLLVMVILYILEESMSKKK